MLLVLARRGRKATVLTARVGGHRAEQRPLWRRLHLADDAQV